jgi:hypothetical protein
MAFNYRKLIKIFCIRRKKSAKHVSPLANILLCRAQNYFSLSSSRINEGSWLRASCFYTMGITFQKYPQYFSDLPKIAFQWSEKLELQENHITIFCEHGWLPRSEYQISSLGVNQRNPITKIFDKIDGENSIREPQDEVRYRNQINILRSVHHNLTPPAIICDEPFFLFALQLTSDLNLKRSGLNLAEISGKKESQLLLRKQLSDIFVRENPSAKILFLQHPAEKSYEAEKLEFPANHVFVPSSRKLRALDIASSPNCLGLITINSNALNEALLFSLPVFQMGDFLMKRFPNHLFPYDLKGFLNDSQYCQSIAQADTYLGVILENQYSIEDLQNPIKLRKLIDKETARFN